MPELFYPGLPGVRLASSLEAPDRGDSTIYLERKGVRQRPHVLQLRNWSEAVAAECRRDTIWALIMRLCSHWHGRTRHKSTQSADIRYEAVSGEAAISVAFIANGQIAGWLFQPLLLWPRGL